MNNIIKNTTEVMDHYLPYASFKGLASSQNIGVTFRNKKWIDLTDRKARDFKVNHKI